MRSEQKVLAWSRLAGTAFSILLISCTNVLPTTPSTTPSAFIRVHPRLQTQTPPISTQATITGQTLPISAQATIAGHTIELEVAQTPQQQAIGLMYRTSLAANRGMLFPFNPPQSVSFWMENTLIPLDMIFLQQGVVKAIAAQVPPCTTNPCPTYGPKTLVDQVIELRGGRAAQLGLKVGDRLKIDFLDSTHPKL